jgi:hypothetical protein
MISRNFAGLRRMVLVRISQMLASRSSPGLTRFVFAPSFWVLRKYTLPAASSSPRKSLSIRISRPVNRSEAVSIFCIVCSLTLGRSESHTTVNSSSSPTDWPSPKSRFSRAAAAITVLPAPVGATSTTAWSRPPLSTSSML